MVPEFIFSQAELSKIAEKYRESYALADPFPHVVIDDFLPPRILDEVLNEFPGPYDIDWINYTGTGWEQKKMESKREEQLPPTTRFLLYQFNSAVFLNFLESLTGIAGLIPDPHLWGGGLHQIQRGGFLKIHADFNLHPYLKIYRRINVLLYLNKNWSESFGGQLELWDTGMTECKAKILPSFNRCVIFNTTTNSFHGHPDPINCPPEMTRKSIALYYYGNEGPAEVTNGRSDTAFKLRPGEKRGSALKAKAARFLPPILLESTMALKAKLKKKRRS
jgi:hypothetical protein